MNNFLKFGFDIKNNFFNKKDCKILLKKILKSRNFKNIWLTQNQYKYKNQILKTVNPRPGRNLIEKVDTKFIFSNDCQLSEKLSTMKLLRREKRNSKYVNSLPEGMPRTVSAAVTHGFEELEKVGVCV